LRNGGSFNVKPQRGGGRAYVGHMPHCRAITIIQTPHHFATNSINTILIKVILVQIALTRAQNANQNPQGGDAIDDQIPHICAPPSGA
jgi:hypothetical protein